MPYQISGRKTVTAAGTAERLAAPDGVPVNTVAIKALNANTSLVYIGNDGADDVAAATGYHLAANEQVVLDTPTGYLDAIWIDVAVSGEGVAWLRLD